jgi:putative membrane protein
VSQIAEAPGAIDAEAPKLDLSQTQSHYSWIRTRLSIERTFLSWTRTATSLIGFGFTVYQFLDKMSQADLKPEAPRNFGLAFIATGIGAMALGLWQRHQEAKYLDDPAYQSISRRDGLPHWKGANVIATVVIGIGLVAFIWVLTGA